MLYSNIYLGVLAPLGLASNSSSVSNEKLCKKKYPPSSKKLSYELPQIVATRCQQMATSWQDMTQASKQNQLRKQVDLTNVNECK